MNKQIRPLAAYKKANFNLYSIIWNETTSKSLKGKENEFYYFYSLSNLGIEHKIGQPNTFFWKDENNKNNIGTNSEIGRLLLFGWYYNIQEFTKGIGTYIYNAYKKVEQKGDVFNDLEFQKAVKHIRNNIIYYYQNEQELKLYILKTFFKEKIEGLLIEKPIELKHHESVDKLLKGIRKNQTKKGANYWINKAEENESYYYYLLEILEENYIEHLTFDKWIEAEKIKDNDYYNKLDLIEKDYNKRIFSNVSKIDLT